MNLVLADVKHGFGVISAGLLQAPRRRVVEVKLAINVTTVMDLAPLEVVALLHSRIGPQGLLDGVSVHIEVMLVTCAHVVFHGVLADGVARALAVATDGDVDDDILLRVDQFQTLIDGRVNVDVPDSTAIHQNHAIDVLRWEDRRN